MKTIVITYTDRLTNKVATYGTIPPATMDNFRENKESWKKRIISQIEGEFKRRVQKDLEAYFGEVDVRVTIGDVSLCKATLTANVFAGRVEAVYQFNKMFE